MKVIKFVSIIFATVLATASLVWFGTTFPVIAFWIMFIVSGVIAVVGFLGTVWALLVALWKAL